MGLDGGNLRGGVAVVVAACLKLGGRVGELIAGISPRLMELIEKDHCVGAVGHQS